VPKAEQKYEKVLVAADHLTRSAEQGYPLGLLPHGDVAGDPWERSAGVHATQRPPPGQAESEARSLVNEKPANFPDVGPLHPHQCYPQHIHRPAKARSRSRAINCCGRMHRNEKPASVTPVEELFTTFVFQRLSNKTHVRMNKAAPPRSGSRAPCLSHLPQDTVARLFILAPPILQKPLGQIYRLSIAAAPESLFNLG
jgi:hypothetical protein